MLKISEWWEDHQLKSLKAEYQDELYRYLKIKSEQAKEIRCSPRCAMLSLSKRKARLAYCRARVAYLELFIERKFHTT